jgi:hypothetical protein
LLLGAALGRNLKRTQAVAAVRCDESGHGFTSWRS